MSREHQQMRVRLPPELRDSLEQMAKKNGRSMNAEIVYRLQRTIDDDTAFADRDGMKYIKDMHIDRAAHTLPAGTVLSSQEIDERDPRYNPDTITEQLKEVRGLLEIITKEMKNKKG
ncbi:Arc family DNA-binding protein [Aeromonas dhakensis]|uniref:Arc family DNA-binding protein n=1 Tax=Aeromonas dhakensis TaxID=196024 RepID=UPI00343C1C69